MPGLSRPAVLLLVVACSMSPFAMSLCVPALPAMRDALGVTDAGVQWVISGFLLSLAVTQPLHGVLTDRYGRRPVIIAGFAVAVLGSLAAAAASTLAGLIVARVVQGAGIATGTVVARAMIRDAVDTDEGARIMTYLSIGMGVAPSIGPLLSGVLVAVFGWAATFLAAAAASTAVLGWLALGLPETRPATAAAGAQHGRQVLADVAHVSRSPLFWGYALMFGFGNAAFFAFLTNGPSFFQAALGEGPARFGVYMGGLALAYVVGATLASRIIGRVGMDGALRLGLIGTGTSATLLVLCAYALPLSAASVLAPMTVLFIAAGLVNPAAMTGAVAHFPRQAGTASGLSSSIGMGTAALGAVLSARVVGDTMTSLTWPITLSIWLSILGYVVVLLSPVPPTAD